MYIIHRHCPHSLRENSSVYSWHNITEVVPVVVFYRQSAAWVLRFQKITDAVQRLLWALLYTADRGSRFLQITGTFIMNYMASCQRRHR
jgi:hypothetical protein